MLSIWLFGFIYFSCERFSSTFRRANEKKNECFPSIYTYFFERIPTTHQPEKRKIYICTLYSVRRCTVDSFIYDFPFPLLQSLSISLPLYKYVPISDFRASCITSFACTGKYAPHVILYRIRLKTGTNTVCIAHTNNKRKQNLTRKCLYFRIFRRKEKNPRKTRKRVDIFKIVVWMSMLPRIDIVYMFMYTYCIYKCVLWTTFHAL